MPMALRSLAEEPTQLYVTVGAPTDDIYEATTRPLMRGAFEMLKETLSLLKNFSCPTVFRITSARGLNMVKPEEYAKLCLSSEPTYIEIKGAMSVGYGIRSGRMDYENMPTMREVEEFAGEISKMTGYNEMGKDENSRVLLLSRLRKPIRFKWA